MSLWNAVIVGLKEIWAHKFRSLLTMLGIILGVSSLIAMSALVTGMEKGAKESLIAVGGLQKMRVEAAPLPVDQRHLRDFATGVTLRDVYALQRSAPEILEVSPQMRLEPQPTLAANGKTYRTWMISGVWPVQLEMMEHTVEHGRMFTSLDNELARNVCVIGDGVRDALWGSPEETGEPVIPIGREMTISGYPFTVVGMFQHYESEQERKTRELAEAEAAQLKAAGVTNSATGPKRSRGWGGSGRGSWSPFRMKNGTVYLPLNTAWLKLKAGLTNSPAEPKLSDMEIKVRDVAQLDLAMTQIRNVLMVTHRGIEDFSFRTQEDWAEQIGTFISNARLSGGIIAGISLLVGGIGIMNIMLASINERIREIGTCKALGATGPAIFTQIVVESAVLSVLGALAGLVASAGLVDVLALISPTANSPVITWQARGIAVAFSAGVGIVAGLFPAIKAARLSPIQALRYE